MLAHARQRVPAARFLRQDIAAWSPAAPLDLVFANAALQFLPEHQTLLPRLFASSPRAAPRRADADHPARSLACGDAARRRRRAVGAAAGAVVLPAMIAAFEDY